LIVVKIVVLCFSKNHLLTLNLIVVKIVVLKEKIEGCPNLLLEEVDNYSQVMSYDVCCSKPLFCRVHSLCYKNVTTSTTKQRLRIPSITRKGLWIIIRFF